jgi:cytochrome c553
VSSLDKNRADHKRYKADVKKEGKPFFPHALFHDSLMQLVVVVVIIALSVIWKFTSQHEGGGTHPGLLGPLYEAKADPGTTSFVPRPDWYFYFLFYLLRIFKWPDSVLLGTVGIPTLLLVIAIALPFVDRRRERHPLRRPVAMITAVLVIVAMGTLTWKGATAKEVVASELSGLVPQWAQKQGYAGNADAEAGAKLFSQSGCLTCHVYTGAGSANLGAPELTAEGTKSRGVDWQIRHLECPSCVNAGSPMPAFKTLGADNLKKLAAFLEASKGPK